MLNGRLSLHEIEDVETFCKKILNEKWSLRPHERDDLLAYLIATAWELSLKYEQRDYHAVRFSTYATPILRSRAVDWLRSYKGRTKFSFADRIYERTLPELVSWESGVADTDTAVDMGAEVHSASDLDRVLRTGPGPGSWCYGPSGERLDVEPEARDRAAA